jgi:RNA polymerase sigma factor (TIGR02999 family)
MDLDITTLLDDWGRGDHTALDRLAPLVYPQLRELASSYLRRERQGHTLQATSLVNELFLKLMAQRQARLSNRQHFYALAGKLMRRALIDHARISKASKRGGGADKVPLHEELSWVDASGPEIIDLDRALTDLEQMDAEQAQMFEMRFLLGCTVDETAELLGTSKSTVDRKVRMARAWLFQRMSDAAEGDSSPTSI